MDNNKKVLTVKEAAEYLGLGRRKVYEMVRDGAIRSMKYGRLYYIGIDDLHDAFHLLKNE